MTTKSLLHSSLLDNQYYTSMLVGNAAYEPAYEDVLIEYVLSSSQTSVTFSNLVAQFGSVYQHFQLRMVGRTDRANNGDGFRMRFNSDTGTNYSEHVLRIENNAVYGGGAGGSSSIEVGFAEANNNTAGSYAGCIVDILDPFVTGKATTVRGFSGFTSSINRTLLNSGGWYNNNAVDSIQIYPNIGPNFLAGTRMTLIGAK